jgi:hypothetical protein
MTVNPKPNSLPGDPTDFWEVTRPLVIDLYLSREGVIEHLGDAVDFGVDPSGKSLTHLEAAHLLRYADAQERRDPERIVRDRPKYQIIRRLGSIYGFRTSSDQDRLIKSQLVHILIAETVGATPSPFELPSDPDIGIYAHQETDADPSNPEKAAPTPGVSR